MVKMSCIAAHQCCITYETMTDPVIDADGHTYERGAIVRWLRNHSTSPMTRRSMTIDELRPNRAVRDAISESRGASNSAFVVFPTKIYMLALLPAKDKEFPYSIHGLWPQEGDWRVRSEGGHEFDIGRLHVLLPELHADWHSSRGADEHFWRHEWEKHGSCTGLTEVEYFQKTLDCFEKVKANGKEWVQQRSNKIPFKIETPHKKQIKSV